ncbi:MAG: DUF1194 domain-containing protein [Alphaproteobacteria bacterium]|nr:DUF1194 domain-containing protein [Alphaproteobacteria bacterium]
MKPPSVARLARVPSSMRMGLWSGLSPYLWTLTLALALVIRSLPAQAQGGQAVDLELTLLVDVSASVSDEEYRLQAGGLATAFRSTAVLNAIRSSAHRGIAVSVIQWANQENQRVSVGWMLVRGEADALGLAARIASMPRLIHGGHTALGSALAFGMQELESNRFAGLRRVIDLSGDGRTNDGRPLRVVREEVIEHGITINGLAILNELPLLDAYFRDHLIGGDGAFFMVAQDYRDFAQAMIHKLVREIRSVPLSENEAPNPVYEAHAETAPLSGSNLAEP